MCPIKLPTKPIFWIFHILKIKKLTELCRFVTYLSDDPRTFVVSKSFAGDNSELLSPA